MNTHRIVVFTGAAGNMGTVFVERSLANCDRVSAIGNDEEALCPLAGAQPKLGNPPEDVLETNHREHRFR